MVPWWRPLLRPVSVLPAPQRRFPVVIGATAAGLLSTAPLQAQNRPGTTALGGRSTLLGGTGVALGRDGAAPFLNPATMSRIGDTKIAFSVRLFRLAWDRIEDFQDPLPGAPPFPDSSVEQRSISTMPSTFCAFVTLAGLIPEDSEGVLAEVRGSSGRTKLGICSATIEREQFDFSTQGAVLEGEGSASALIYDVGRSWQRYSIGPSLSYQIDHAWSVGASLHAVSTTAERRWEVHALRADSNSSDVAAFSDSLQGRSWDGALTAGVGYAFGRQTLGVALRLPSVHLTSGARATSFRSSSTTPAELESLSGEFSAPPPATLSLGTGAEWPNALVEANVTYVLGSDGAIESNFRGRRFGAQDSSGEATERSSRERLRSTASFHVGGEAFVSPTLSILAGARVEPSAVANPLASAPNGFAQARLHQAGGSLGVGSYGSATELLVGVQVAHQWGQAVTFAPDVRDPSYRLSTQRGFTALVVLSGSVNLRSLRHAVQSFKELGDPHAAPPSP